ncbi:MAG: NUDIX domain-containing protein [Bacilli bacterium]
MFTVENGITKILLIKRKNNPYKDMWALVGGALYNNETLEEGMKREIIEKTSIQSIDLTFSHVFSEVDRSPVMRMIAVSYIGVIDYKRVNIMKDTLTTSNADWFSINELPKLAYDHNHIIIECLETLKKEIFRTNILEALFPDGFTIPEIQKTYEIILNKTFDRRNFRKQLLSNKLIKDTNKHKVFEGKKPAKLYCFK